MNKQTELKPISDTKQISLSDLLYADYSLEDLQGLTEWECQDAYGGKMPFCDDAFCKHPECHPLNDERIRKSLGI